MLTNQKLARAFTHGWLHVGIYYVYRPSRISQSEFLQPSKSAEMNKTYKSSLNCRRPFNSLSPQYPSPRRLLRRLRFRNCFWYFDNSPSHSCLLSDLALVWRWGWSWPCFDRNLLFKTKSTSASFSLKGQDTKHITKSSSNREYPGYWARERLFQT